MTKILKKSKTSKSELSVGQHVINRKIYLTETITFPTFARRATLCVKALCHPNGWDLCAVAHPFSIGCFRS